MRDTRDSLLLLFLMLVGFYSRSFALYGSLLHRSTRNGVVRTPIALRTYSSRRESTREESRNNASRTFPRRQPRYVEDDEDPFQGQRAGYRGPSRHPYETGVERRGPRMDRREGSSQGRLSGRSDRGNRRDGGRMRIDFRHEEEETREKPYGDYEGDHLYGVNPIKAALVADRRDFKELLVQEGQSLSAKKDSKGAMEIMRLAKSKGVETRMLSKHDLNMLSGNRPHQGFVLRASPLHFKRLGGSAALAPSPLDEGDRHRVVLALDEVWDPQNFGALLRTSHFLPGVAEVVVCAKNSAPLSETVSKASAGAMEVQEIYAVDNMMRFLDKSRENGWQVVGTSVGEGSIKMEEVPKDKPTILVLGNEGHGIRTNVLKRCSHLVRVDGGSADGIDSLNVSVTGGILLHYLST